ncbi:hypothetical protein LEP3755_34100 [Leptolyngbya sp. NIES-3755]|nr:hypothetical protein LEP3755_34100 [Leptolyngbya sp. NIES-3755]
MNFSPYQVDRILTLLGYGIGNAIESNALTTLIRNNLLSQDYSAALSERVEQIIDAELPQVEAQKMEILDVIYVQSTKGVQLTPASGLALLNQRGSSLLKELAGLLDIPIRSNKYQAGGGSNSSTISYW